MSILSILAEVGLDKKALAKVVAEDPEIRAGVIRKAQEVQAYWKSIAPVGTRTHTLKSGYVDEPGDYRDSIVVKYRKDHEGRLEARVVATDYKAHWLEYGSVHNKEGAYAQRTVDHFNGTTAGGAVVRG